MLWANASAMFANTKFSAEQAVTSRYSAAAREKETALCCPVDYDPGLLKAIPAEVVEKDYGCGDPSKYLHPGEIVLDLGSGAGKICFIASQIVGPKGKVIGVDMTDEMLEVARRNAPLVAEKIGWGNVEFRKGRIQDLALNPELLDAELRRSPVRDLPGYLELEQTIQRLRREKPLIASGSVDVVVSNCVLNLVEADSKAALFREIFRVLRDTGRAVISDIVADREVPIDLQNDPELWSGCISGAFTQIEFVNQFTAAGFGEVETLKLELEPWREVNGIAFRSMTVRAWKSRKFEITPLPSLGRSGNRAESIQTGRCC